MKSLESFESAIVEEFQDELKLPEYLYTSIYIKNMKEIKESGLSPEISNLSWNDSIPGFIFLTEESEYAGLFADQSKKVDSAQKECIFILKIESKKLNRDNIFIYNETEESDRTIYVYHGSLPYSLVEIAFSYY